MKNIVQTKTLSLMLALAMLLSLVPGMGLTAYAASINAFGGQSVTISSDQTCTSFDVLDGSTLTVNQGVTLTLNMNDGHSFNLFDNSNLELHGTLAGSVGSGATWMDNTYINVYLSDGAKYTVTGLSCMDGDNYLRYYGYDAATDGNGTVSVMNGTTDVTASSIGYKTTTYTFTATPSSGYRFVSWTKGASGEVLGTDASINVTCEQNGQYQVYANFEVAHTHSFTYSASGDTITATCSVANCTLTDSKATLTIAAPALTTYGGTGSAAATLTGLTDFNSATGKTIAATDIKYVGRDGTTYTESTTAPTNAGKYTAKITVEEKTASVNYEIAKVNPTCTVPTGLTATYGQTLKDVTLPTGWAWSDGTQSVGNAGTNTFKANFTPTDTNNYNTVSNVNISVTVGKANPTYTVPTGLTATYGQTLANVTLPTGWSWADGTQSVGNVGTNTFKANFTPADTANYNTVSGVDVTVTVGKAAGKDAVISTDTMTYNADSIYIEGVEGQEYIIVPKGTAVTDADWNTSVKPDPERDNWVFFENLKEATEYEIYTRTAETDTAFASDAVKANVYTTLSSIGYDYDSTLVGASITVEPESDVEGLTYKWYQDEVTEDDEGIIHHNLTEIPGASGSTYTFREEDAGKNIAVKIFSGDSEVGDFATDAPVASTAKVIFESKGGSDVETLTDAVYQSKIKAPADPTREGFAFDGWYWDEEFETPFDFEKDVITWTETTLYAKWTPNDYKITSVTGLTGANNKQWTKGGKDAVVITVKVSGEDNSFDHFTGVKLDGKELVKDVDYTVEKGSTIVTLKPETLEKLSVGEHTITVLFDNGEVNTTLTVLAANSQDATSPQTGDNSHMGLWIALMMFSLCGLAATFFIGKKKRVFGR